MISAWVLYWDIELETWHFEVREGQAFSSIDDVDWGLGAQHEVILVLQNAQFVGAWLDGSRVDQ